MPEYPAANRTAEEACRGGPCTSEETSRLVRLERLYCWTGAGRRGSVWSRLPWLHPAWTSSTLGRTIGAAVQGCYRRTVLSQRRGRCRRVGEETVHGSPARPLDTEHGGAAILNAQLAENALQMMPDRVLRDTENERDLPVALALLQPLQHLVLPHRDGGAQR